MLLRKFGWADLWDMIKWKLRGGAQDETQPCPRCAGTGFVLRGQTMAEYQRDKRAQS